MTRSTVKQNGQFHYQKPIALTNIKRSKIYYNEKGAHGNILIRHGCYREKIQTEEKAALSVEKMPKYIVQNYVTKVISGSVTMYW